MRTRFIVLLLILLAPGAYTQDYKQALPGYQYQFPRDHFNHPDYQTEWWYYTGNLKSADGHRFGFELTFFRQGVSRDSNDATWHVHDIYMAHLALSDISGRRFYHDERINRAGPGIASLDAASGAVWNGNWRALLGDQHQSLRAAEERFGIQLELASTKPPVIHGRNGVSQKSAGVGHASHYISFTRLLTSGEVSLNGTRYKVEGTSWMDHEFFTESLGTNETGWDWLSLQFDDNTEVMLYRLRHKDGSVDPYSSGTYVDVQGKSVLLSAKDFTMTPTGETWTSEESHGKYPVQWRVTIPGLSLQADISTPLANQELASRIGPTYWEGAIDISGQHAGKSLRGVGYLEMTGYGGSHSWGANRSNNH